MFSFYDEFALKEYKNFRPRLWERERALVIFGRLVVVKRPELCFANIIHVSRQDHNDRIIYFGQKYTCSSKGWTLFSTTTVFIENKTKMTQQETIYEIFYHPIEISKCPKSVCI